MVVVGRPEGGVLYTQGPGVPWRRLGSLCSWSTRRGERDLKVGEGNVGFGSSHSRRTSMVEAQGNRKGKTEKSRNSSTTKYNLQERMYLTLPNRGLTMTFRV